MGVGVERLNKRRTGRLPAILFLPPPNVSWPLKACSVHYCFVAILFLSSLSSSAGLALIAFAYSYVTQKVSGCILLMGIATTAHNGSMSAGHPLAKSQTPMKPNDLTITEPPKVLRHLLPRCSNLFQPLATYEETSHSCNPANTFQIPYLSSFTGHRFLATF
jgi:hypothetical protein